MPSIALTGASGHLGYVIHKMLLRDGISHRLLLRKPVDYINSNDIVWGALEEDDKLDALTRDCNAVIHCAGKIWPRFGTNKSVVDVNFNRTKRLYNIASKNHVNHFVYISSIHSMLPPGLENTFDESAALVNDPRRSYDFSKAESERFLTSQDNIKTAVLNPTAIIGPGDHYYHGMNQLFRRINNRKLPAITSGGFNVVDVRDIANAAIQASLRQVSGKYILGNQYIKMKDLAWRYGEVNGCSVTKRVIGHRVMRILAGLSAPVERLGSKAFALNTYSVETLLEGNQIISSNAAKQDLHLELKSLDETLKDTNTWLKTGTLKF